jgi:hypothetical protein
MIASLVVMCLGAVLMIFAAFTQVLIEHSSNAFNWVNTISMYTGVALVSVGLASVVAQVIVA